MPRLRPTIATAAGLLVLAAATPAAAYPRPGRTELISRAPDGSTGNAASVASSISADGRFVAFESDAENLVPHDTNGATDIFVYDRLTGEVDRASVSGDGTAASGHSYEPVISGDGRYVAFESDAENLVPPDPGDNNRARDIFVHDRVTGETEIVSVGPDDSPANQSSAGPAISADGHHVAFMTAASNFASGDVNPGSWDVFVRDHVANTTTRASIPMTGSSLDGIAYFPSISRDGRFVAFASTASNHVTGDTNRIPDIYVHDMQTGITKRLAVPPGQEPNGLAGSPSISGDGRLIAFSSVASNLVPEDTNGIPQAGGQDVFVVDRVTDAIERVSMTSDGVEADSDSYQPSISDDGRYVAFESQAGNLASGDAGGGVDPITGWVYGDGDLFVHDRLAGTTDRISLTDTNTEPDGATQGATISGDGSTVAFLSTAPNMPGGASAQAPQVYVRDRGPDVGVGGLTAREEGGALTVSGWATFSGTPLASVGDPDTDGGPGAKDAGAELTSVGLAYRPEGGDLLARVHLASLPSVRPYHPSLNTGQFQYGNLAPSTAVNAGVLYTIELTHGGTRYEVRVTRLRDDGTTEPSITLWRCPTTCTEVAPLAGSIGEAGDEIRVALPLSRLGAKEGDALTGIRFHTAAGDTDRGALRMIDEASIGGVVLPATEVLLGVAPAGTAPDEVVFDTAVALLNGSFSSTLSAAGDEVWARACLGSVCAVTRTSIDR